MANKKNQLDDFDFDNIDFDDFDAYGGSGAKKGKDKGPFRKMARSFGEGSREALTDPQVIKRFAASALPDGYGTAINVTSDLKDGVAELYNNAARELRPALPAMRKMAGKLADSSKYNPFGLKDKLKDFSKSPEHQYQQSAEEQQNAAIGAEVAGVFATAMHHQTTLQATEIVDRKIRDRVQDKMTVASLKRLDAMRGGIDRLVAYQDQVTIKYQQKSLELQYRQLYATREILAVHKSNQLRDNEFYNHLLANTAMSDGAKARAEEKEDGKLANRLKNQFQQQVVKHFATFGDQLKKNLNNSIGAAMQGVSSAFDFGEMASDTMESGADFGMTPSQMIANMIGRGLTEGALRMVSEPLRKMAGKNGKVSGVGGLLNYYGQNWQEHLTKWAKSSTNGDSIFSDFLNLLKEGVPRKGIDNSFGEGPIYNADAPAQFNMQTRRSINEVIPGYLMRIHHELMLQRDKDAQPLVYNMMRGTFTGQGAATKDAMRQIFQPRRITQARDSIDQYITKYIDPDGQLDKGQREKLKRQLYMDTQAGEVFDPDRFLNDNEGMSELSGNDRAAVQNLIRSRYKTGDKHADWSSRDKSNTEFVKLRNTLPDPKAAMTAWRDVGQKQFLIDHGFVDSLNGVDTMNMGKIMEYILKDAEGDNTPNDPTQRTAMDAIRERASRAFGQGVTAAQDVYANGLDSPVLQEAKMQAGHYLDVASGKIIETVEDITGPVKDIRKNSMVITIEQAIEGVKVRGRGVLKKAQAGARLLRQKNRGKINQAQNFVTGIPGQVRGAMQNLQAKAKKIYSIYEDAGGGRPGAVALIDAGRLEAGEYQDMITGKVLESVDDIKGPVLDLRDNRQVLRAEHFAKGLVNEQGQSLKRLVDRVSTSVKGMFETHVAPRMDAGKAMFSNQGIAPEAGAQAGQTQIANFDQLVSLSATQVELLTGIYDILATRNFTAAPGEGSPTEAKQYQTWAQRIKNIPKNVKDGMVKARGKTWDLMGTGLRKATGGAMWLVGKGASLYGRFLKTVGGAAVGVAKGIVTAPFKLAGMMGGGFFSDVWVKGGKTPALYAKKMKNGDYFDKATGKVIKSIKDIRGEVIELSNGEPIVVLTADEYASGLFDTKGRKLGGFLTGTLVNTFKAALGGYAALVRLPFHILRGMANLATAGVKRALRQPDVYVKTDPKTPRLRGILMEQGQYYSVRSKRIIYKHQQIDGAIREANEDGRELVSEEEFKAGLVDWRGNPLGTGFEKMAGAVMGAAGFAAKMAGRLAKGAVQMWGGIMGFTKDVFLGMLTRVGGIFNPKIYTTTSQKTNDLLEAIHDLIDARMPNNGEGRAGSWQSQLKKRREAAGKRLTGGPAKDDSKGLFGMLKKGGAGLASLFGFGDDEEDEDDGDTTIIGGFGGDGDGKKRRRRKPRGRFGKMWDGLKSKMPGKGLLGKIPKGKLGILTALAGMFGADWLGDKLGGKVGTALEVASTASMVPGALSALGIGGGGAAAAAGTAAAGTAAAGGGAAAAGGGLAALAGGILGAPLLPIALGAAAIGYVGYKAFKKYKYGTYEPMRAFRMTQYGIDWNNTSDVEKMVEFEQMLQPSVRGGDIMGDKVSMDDVYKHFGISGLWNGIKRAASWLNPITAIGNLFGGPPSREQFNEWFNKRFKPVFIAWHGATNALTNSNMNDSDDKLDPDKKTEVLRKVNGISREAYQVQSGPFGKIKLTGSDVEAAFAKALATVAKDKKNGGKKSFIDKIDKLSVSMVGAMFGDKAAGLTQSMLDKRNGMIDKVKGFFGFGEDKKTLGASSKTFKGAGGGPKLGGTVSALDAVRYRTYGLTDMDAERVRAVAYLEWAVASKLSFNESGDATFDGDVGELYEEYGPMFNSGFWHRMEWMSWFDNRFMPTLIAFGSAVRRCGVGGNILDASKTLKPEHKLEVAQATLAASSRHGWGLMQLVKRSVWKVTDSPWPDFAVNTDQRTTHDNMMAMREALKNKQLTEDKGKDAGGKGAKGTASTKGAESAQRQSAGASFMSRVKDAFGNAYDSTKNALGNAYNATKNAVGDAYDSAKGAIGSAYNSVANAASSTYNSVSSTAQAALAKGAQLVGLNMEALWAKVAPLIASGESMGGNYDAQNGVPGNITKGLSQMTIGQVHSLATSIGRSDGNGPKTGAAGKYQFIPPTLLAAMKKAGLKLTDQFSPANQEKMGRALFDMRVKNGVKNGVTGILDQLAMEWASLPSPTKGGASWWGGVAGNKAHGGSKRLEELIAAVTGSGSAHAGTLPNTVTAGKPDFSGVKGSVSSTASAGSSKTGGAQAAGATPVSAYDLAAAKQPGGAGYGSSLDQASSNSIPTPHASAPGAPDGIRPTSLQDSAINKQREAAAQAAVATDMRSQLANEDAARQLASVTGLLDEQLKTQKSMDAKLGDITQVLKSLKGSSFAGAAPAGAGEQTNSQKPPARGLRKTEEMAPAPISVRRRSIG